MAPNILKRIKSVEIAIKLGDDQGKIAKHRYPVRVRPDILSLLAWKKQEERFSGSYDVLCRRDSDTYDSNNVSVSLGKDGKDDLILTLSKSTKSNKIKIKVNAIDRHGEYINDETNETGNGMANQFALILPLIKNIWKISTILPGNLYHPKHPNACCGQPFHVHRVWVPRGGTSRSRINPERVAK